MTVASSASEFACPDCDRQFYVLAGASSDGGLSQCAVCGCQELFIRKDFSQRLGLTIVVVGFVASSIAWGFHMKYLAWGVLFATALIDVTLYATVGNLLQCYRCAAMYRGSPGIDRHAPFSLETHERFRQQVARVAEQERAADH